VRAFPAAPGAPSLSLMTARFTLSPVARRAILTAHIVFSVGLLGDSAGFLAVAVRASVTDDAELAASSWELLEMFSIVFGIPLTCASLVTGVALGLGTKWGVLRYPWTMIKLGLVLSVAVVGGTLIGPSLQELQDGASGAEGRVIAGAAWDVLALTLATGLSVFKPGRRRAR
jgi:uncharacterized membrane protein